MAMTPEERLDSALTDIEESLFPEKFWDNTRRIIAALVADELEVGLDFVEPCFVVNSREDIRRRFRERIATYRSIAEGEK